MDRVMSSRLEGVMPDPGGQGAGPAEERFDALYRDHHQEIVAYCLRRMPRPAAEDVAADVFAVAWRRIDDVPQHDEAIAWLFAIGRAGDADGGPRKPQLAGPGDPEAGDLDQLPPATIADMLGISEPAVGQRVHRARRRLGDELARLESSFRASKDEGRLR